MFDSVFISEYIILQYKLIDVTETRRFTTENFSFFYMGIVRCGSPLFVGLNFILKEKGF